MAANIYGLMQQAIEQDQRLQILIGTFVAESSGRISWTDLATRSSDGLFYPATDGLAALCTVGDPLLIVRVQRLGYVVVAKLVV